jgi:hypothetical protein
MKFPFTMWYKVPVTITSIDMFPKDHKRVRESLKISGTELNKETANDSNQWLTHSIVDAPFYR